MDIPGGDIFTPEEEHIIDSLNQSLQDQNEIIREQNYAKKLNDIDLWVNTFENPPQQFEAYQDYQNYRALKQFVIDNPEVLAEFVQFHSALDSPYASCHWSNRWVLKPEDYTQSRAAVILLNDVTIKEWKNEHIPI